MNQENNNQCCELCFKGYFANFRECNDWNCSCHTPAVKEECRCWYTSDAGTPNPPVDERGMCKHGMRVSKSPPAVKGGDEWEERWRSFCSQNHTKMRYMNVDEANKFVEDFIRKEKEASYNEGMEFSIEFGEQALIEERKNARHAVLEQIREMVLSKKVIISPKLESNRQFGNNSAVDAILADLAALDTME